MDVGMSVPLLREQLGAVIEQAVAAAVETVLGEMARVVGSRFEELRKEMSAKEKENESIKQMLEISRCQMKMMRKYLSALGTKDDRQVALLQARSGQQPEAAAAHRPLVGCRPTARRPPAADDGGLDGKRPGVCFSEGLIRAVAWDRLPQDVENGAGLPRGDSPLHASHFKVEYRDAEVDGGCQRSQEGREPPRGARPPRLSQATCAEAPDPTPTTLHKTDARAAAESTSPKAWATPFQAKEEEAAADIEVVRIKEEPDDAEACSLEPQCPRADPGVQGREQPQGWQERPGVTNAVCSEEMAAAFTAAAGGGGGAFVDGQRLAPGPPRQVRRRQWMKEPVVCEDYKHRRAELKRRSQHRRRELEKSLPQPLLAALVRERREKTRLRVARWRAKRKLQAGLMAAEPAQLAIAPPSGVRLPHTSDSLLCRRQPVALPQYSSLLYGGPHGDSSRGDGGSTHYPTLQFSSHPLLPGLRHAAANAVAQPGMLGMDSEVYQQSLS